MKIHFNFDKWFSHNNRKWKEKILIYIGKNNWNKNKNEK